MPRIKEVFLKYFKDKRYKAIIILALAGIFLISLSSFLPEDKAETKNYEAAFDIEKFRKDKEKELENFIGKIDGISSCRVMISYKDSGSTTYSFNSMTSSDKEEQKRETEMVIRRTDGNEYPVTEKITGPEINGVTVIANGRKGLEIKVAKAVSAGLGADIHNVEVIINERN